MYELLMESFSRTYPIENLSQWFSEFSIRRYGQKINEAEKGWQILGRVVNFSYFSCLARNARSARNIIF